MMATSEWFIKYNANGGPCSMKLVVLNLTLSSTRCGDSDQGRGNPLPWQTLKPGSDINKVNPMSNWCWKVIHAIISGIFNISCTCVQNLSHLEFNCDKVSSIICLFSVFKIKEAVFGRATSEISQVLVEGTKGNV